MKLKNNEVFLQEVFAHRTVAEASSETIRNCGLRCKRSDRGFVSEMNTIPRYVYAPQGRGAVWHDTGWIMNPCFMPR